MPDIHGQILLHRLTESIGDAMVQSMTAVANCKADAMFPSSAVMAEYATHDWTGKPAVLACAGTRLGDPSIVRWGN